MVEAAVRKYGALHILYNNAGIVGANIDGDVTQLTVETWDRILNINLRGIFLCSKYGVPALIQAGGGSVINTASIAGLIGSPFAGHAYTASKGGVIALTRAMAMVFSFQYFLRTASAKVFNSPSARAKSLSLRRSRLSCRPKDGTRYVLPSIADRSASASFFPR
jgi:NADP-dependent 3-hydroxy acid dehydrogenase YdfG